MAGKVVVTLSHRALRCDTATTTVEGGAWRNKARRGPEEPDVLIVPGARIYDLVTGPRTSIRARSSIAASEAGQMAASDYVPTFFKKPLAALGGAPPMSPCPSFR
jgi:hypothetical protein